MERSLTTHHPSPQSSTDTSATTRLSYSDHILSSPKPSFHLRAPSPPQSPESPIHSLKSQRFYLKAPSPPQSSDTSSSSGGPLSPRHPIPQTRMHSSSINVEVGRRSETNLDVTVEVGRRSETNLDVTVELGIRSETNLDARVEVTQRSDTNLDARVEVTQRSDTNLDASIKILALLVRICGIATSDSEGIAISTLVVLYLLVAIGCSITIPIVFIHIFNGCIGRGRCDNIHSKVFENFLIGCQQLVIIGVVISVNYRNWGKTTQQLLIEKVENDPFVEFRSEYNSLYVRAIRRTCCSIYCVFVMLFGSKALLEFILLMKHQVDYDHVARPVKYVMTFVGTLFWSWSYCILIVICLTFRLTCQTRVMEIDFMGSLVKNTRVNTLDQIIKMNESLAESVEQMSSRYSVLVIWLIIGPNLFLLTALYFILKPYNDLVLYLRVEVLIDAVVQFLCLIVVLSSALDIYKSSKRLVTHAALRHGKAIVNEEEDGENMSGENNMSSAARANVEVDDEDTDATATENMDSEEIKSLVNIMEHCSIGFSILGWKLGLIFLCAIYSLELALIMFLIGLVLQPN